MHHCICIITFEFEEVRKLFIDGIFGDLFLLFAINVSVMFLLETSESFYTLIIKCTFLKIIVHIRCYIHVLKHVLEISKSHRKTESWEGCYIPHKSIEQFVFKKFIFFCQVPTLLLESLVITFIKRSIYQQKKMAESLIIRR